MSKDTRLSLDEAVEYLTAHPDEIGEAWSYPLDHAAGKLFDYIAPSLTGRTSFHCGCPTLIKSGLWAVNKDLNADDYLTSRIRQFHIPRSGYDITVADLPKFARIQKLADTYYKERGWRK